MSAAPVILITGASSGIGAACARLSGGNGWRVALAARRLDRLEALAAEIRTAGGDALALKTDISQSGDVQAMVDAVLAQWGQIDVLLNNAGFGRIDCLEALDPQADIEQQIQVNLLGAILASRAALPSMIARRSGHIINMASIAGLIGLPTYSVYSATKFGLRGFTDALRREVRALGIWVSGIYPAGVATEFSQRTGIHRKAVATTPPALRLSAEQVAAVVWKTVQRPRRTVVIPGAMLVRVWAAALLPGLADWLIERRYVRSKIKAED